MYKKKFWLILIIALIIVVSITFLVVCAVNWVTDTLAFGKEKAALKMNADWEEISTITDFLITVDTPFVSFKKGDRVNGSQFEITNENMFTDNDTETRNAVARLILERKYKSVIKDKNYIKFLQWTWFMDEGRGVVYSIDGNEPEIQYVTLLEPLDRPGWYYYESDFNKWRSQNDK